MGSMEPELGGTSGAQKFYRLQLAVCVKLCAWVELCLAGVQAGLIFSTQEPWAIWFLMCRSAS
jgi:hypothetical protein